MMTFVVAAVDDRTDEPLRHGDGSGVAVCALRAAGFFGGAMAPSAGAEPYGSTAGTGTISHPCHALLRRSQSAQPTNFLPTNSLPPHSRLSDRSTWPGIPR